MPYMRNAWYCVGYPEDIAVGTLKSITVLGEPLLIFRRGDFREIEARPGWTRVSGYLKTPVYYELINDNLLDLTHVRYLHAFLTGVEGERVEPLRMEVRLEQKGETVVSINENFSDGCSPVVHLMWEHGAPPDLIDSRFNMRWDAPALMLLDSGFTRAGGARSDGPSFPSAHLLTPETETTTHYFWVITRNTHVDRADVSQQVAHAAMAAFGSEDSPMIQACQHNMGTTDLMSLNPVLLQTDAAPMRARRVLRSRLEAKACAA